MLPLTNIKGTNLWAVEIPINSIVHSIKIEESPVKGIDYFINYQTLDFDNAYIVLKQYFELIGTVSKDNIYFDASEIADTKNLSHLLTTNIDAWFDACNQRLYSLLADNGIWFENPKMHPVDIDPTNRTHYEAVKEAWQTAESKTIKGLLVIIKSVK